VSIEEEQMAKVEETRRGFQIVNLVDGNGMPYTIQESSRIGNPHLWLGPENPPVLQQGTEEDPGWKDVVLPERTEIFARMHLNREQVKELTKHLIAWLATNSLDVTE
jgi:hypothetical protein